MSGLLGVFPPQEYGFFEFANSIRGLHETLCKMPQEWW